MFVLNYHELPWSTIVFHGQTTMVNHVLLNGCPWFLIVLSMVDHGVDKTIKNHGQPFNKTWSTMVVWIWNTMVVHGQLTVIFAWGTVPQKLDKRLCKPHC